MTDEAPGPLVWSLPEPPGRPTTSLSRAEILRAAVTIADAEGARALTMRRVATAVGASTPMSLYRYVGSKDGLVDLMIDAVYGEIPLSAADAADWRTGLERLALDTWAVLQRHLWFGELVHTRPPLGPNALRYFDFRFALLEPLGLSADELTLLTGAVDGHLFGAALQAAEEQAMRTRSGLHSEDDLQSAVRPYLEPILADDRYPAFARWFRAQTGAGPDDPIAWTLACLLDGMTERLGLPTSANTRVAER
ncbi:TetR/AcrR family transcriptional regulator [Nocardia sp. CDC159]|uniref:TetR/AcrR family transcriptional regulator n=1 Tax=Nocardia pulmonis TaxID=2951408 RepID=A0A9X2E8M4_9NOCA|nr:MULTISPECIES: TetR/AcrR family transcriptional regulator [Nocardia]MCM6775774.1 TetR/AcrR family transcriptional regulator [Nocardia pulmonis]MCM6788250.1 TetR/AcrR family transcriptional regulator [Nocardia sp. CDC159]